MHNKPKSNGNNVPSLKEIEARPIIFDCTYLKMRGKWSWSKGKKEDQDRVRKKLKEYSGWKVHQFKAVQKPRLWDSNKEPTYKKGDISEELHEAQRYRFRIGNKIRVIGFFVEHRFFIVWIDWTHETGA